MKPLMKSKKWNELRTLLYKGAGLATAIGVVLAAQNPESNWPYLAACEIASGVLIWVARYVVPEEKVNPVQPPPPQ